MISHCLLDIASAIPLGFAIIFQSAQRWTEGQWRGKKGVGTRGQKYYTYTAIFLKQCARLRQKLRRPISDVQCTYIYIYITHEPPRSFSILTFANPGTYFYRMSYPTATITIHILLVVTNLFFSPFRICIGSWTKTQKLLHKQRNICVFTKSFNAENPNRDYD